MGRSANSFSLIAGEMVSILLLALTGRSIFLYGLALAVIGYIASPAVLSLEEMASGCRTDQEALQHASPTVH